MAFDADVIIIGTGFGATVAATEIAQRGKRVLMLERGLWWFTPERPISPYILQRSQDRNSEQPLQYWPRPNNSNGILNFLSVVRTNSAAIEGLRDVGNFFNRLFGGGPTPRPLYRYNMFDEIDIVTASGVGGGSLIYSNVTLEPEWDAAAQQYPVMQGWPVQLQPPDYDDARAWMSANRGKLHKVVTKVPLPPGLNLDPANLDADHEFLYLGKSRALRVAAHQLGYTWKPLDLSIIDYDGIIDPDTQGKTDAAINGTFCERQGRCFLGCLPAARHTLNKTILKKLLDVPNPVVTLRSLAEVQTLRSLAGGGYQVSYNDLRDGSPHSASAPQVIVAAGCLGSTELMLRSSKAFGGQLALSQALGKGFSSNGDFAGFVILPRASAVYPVFPTRGPINTSHVRTQAVVNNRRLYLNLEDGAVPSMFAAVTRAALNVLDNAAQSDPFTQALKGMWTSASLPDLLPFLPQLPDPTDPGRFRTEDEMLADVFFFNCMGTDDAAGTFDLDGNGQLRLRFLGGPLAQQPVFKAIEAVMRQMAQAMGGAYAPFPLWDGLGVRKVVTVHPLGGCRMSNNSTDGVVDSQGRVYNLSPGPQGFYDGLYVLDASIIPGPLAVNPTLTIVALAKKLVAAIP
ncbi:MAG TPA: GMC oxidoreductase [Terriglobia bacterium]|nr:GMC oxidoreductase [Terriglobia bacterium]